jgi:predicted transcriptional regulator
MMRRNRVGVIVDILAALRGKDLRFTPLLYKSNLSHVKLTGYLKDLMSQGMVEQYNAKDITWYRITDKGLRFYYDYHSLHETLASMGQTSVQVGASA